MTDLLPTETLEQRAEEQRQRLHNTVAELRTTVRDRLDVEKVARLHIWSISTGVAMVALVFGYGVTGLFTE